MVNRYITPIITHDDEIYSQQNCQSTFPMSVAGNSLQDQNSPYFNMYSHNGQSQIIPQNNPQQSHLCQNPNPHNHNHHSQHHHQNQSLPYHNSNSHPSYLRSDYMFTLPENPRNEYPSSYDMSSSTNTKSQVCYSNSNPTEYHANNSADSCKSRSESSKTKVLPFQNASPQVNNFAHYASLNLQRERISADNDAHHHGSQQIFLQQKQSSYSDSVLTTQAKLNNHPQNNSTKNNNSISLDQNLSNIDCSITFNSAPDSLRESPLSTYHHHNQHNNNNSGTDNYIKCESIIPNENQLQPLHSQKTNHHGAFTGLVQQDFLTPIVTFEQPEQQQKQLQQYQLQQQKCGIVVECEEKREPQLHQYQLEKWSQSYSHSFIEKQEEHEDHHGLVKELDQEEEEEDNEYDNHDNNLNNCNKKSRISNLHRYNNVYEGDSDDISSNNSPQRKHKSISKQGNLAFRESYRTTREKSTWPTRNGRSQKYKQCRHRNIFKNFGNIFRKFLAYHTHFTAKALEWFADAPNQLHGFQVWIKKEIRLENKKDFIEGWTLYRNEDPQKRSFKLLLRELSKDFFQDYILIYLLNSKLQDLEVHLHSVGPCLAAINSPSILQKFKPI